VLYLTDSAPPQPWLLQQLFGQLTYFWHGPSCLRTFAHTASSCGNTFPAQTAPLAVLLSSPSFHSQLKGQKSLPSLSPSGPSATSPMTLSFLYYTWRDYFCQDFEYCYFAFLDGSTGIARGMPDLLSSGCLAPSMRLAHSSWHTVGDGVRFSLGVALMYQVLWETR
jgi:hypothetical protein